MTYRKAMRVLRERHLIETFHGDGTYVRDDIPDLPAQEEPDKEDGEGLATTSA